MAGHSHSKNVFRKKSAIDKKRGQLFSKLLRAISVAAKQNPNAEANPTLKSAIEKAKANQIPKESIERAIQRASEEKSEHITIEAYAPSGAALIVEAITDNKNRTLSEIKKILSDFGSKLAQPGSVKWMFEKSDGEWKPKFKHHIEDQNTKDKILKLISALEDHDDVENVISNI